MSSHTHEKTKELTEKLEQGVKTLFDSEKYAEYLRFMSKFHNYSFGNVILILSQKPDAQVVAGYTAWKKLGRQVRKGETAIGIIAPCPHKKTWTEKNDNGDLEEKERTWTGFKAAYVFDISQTDGKEIPTVVETLTDSVDGYADLFEKLRAIAPVPILVKPIRTGANGFYDHKNEQIVIKEGLPQAQTIKTAVHEITHSMLHCKDGEQGKADRLTREVQAESVAYVVCNALGLDTSEYSFGHIAGWSSGKDVKELTASLKVIQKTADAILAAIEAEGKKVA